MGNDFWILIAKRMMKQLFRDNYDDFAKSNITSNCRAIYVVIVVFFYFKLCSLLRSTNRRLRIFHHVVCICLVRGNLTNVSSHLRVYSCTKYIVYMVLVPHCARSEVDACDLAKWPSEWSGVLLSMVIAPDDFVFSSRHIYLKCYIYIWIRL